MNNFQKGLIQDTTEYNQPPHSYRYALNMSFESNSGDMFAIGSESGNKLKLKVGKTIIGTQLLPDEQLLLYSTDETVSEIGIYNLVTEEYSVLIQSTCLGFSSKYPIRSLMRIRKGCERIIYFTDRHNPYRSINLDDLSSYTDDVDNANALDNWDCDKFKLSPNYKIPNINLVSVNDAGGSLPVGTYVISLRYLDSDLNPSNFLYSTNPIPIVDEPLSGSYASIDGGLPEVNTGTAYTGSVPTTNKSITIDISNLDESQSYVQLAFIHYNSATQAVSKVNYSEPLSIQDTVTYTYDGTGEIGDLNDIIIDNETIDIVNHHAQYDSSLWLAGLKNTVHDYSEYQRYASKIKVEWVTKQTQVTNQTHPGDPKCPETYWDTRTFMGDEVYALGIAYRYKNGTLSPVFHIPGRPVTENDLISIPASNDTAHLGSGDQPRWKVENTGYYQLDSHKYPKIKGCDNEYIWGVDYDGNPLVDTPIRHHRAPSRRDIPTYDASTDSINIIGLQFSNIEYPDSDIVGHVLYAAKRNPTDETVHDMAIFNSVIEDSDRFSFQAFNVVNSPVSFTMRTYWSPKMLFDRHIIQGSHVKWTNRIEADYSVSTSGPYQVVGLFNLNKNSQVGKLTYLNTYNQTTTVNGKIAKQYLVSPYTYIPQDSSVLPKPFYNFSVTNPTGLVIFDSTQNESASQNILLGIFSSFYKEVYTDLFNIIYRPLSNGDLKAESASDTFTLYSGDSFVTYMNLHTINAPQYSQGIIDDTFNDLYEAILIDSQYISGVWVDSVINTALRHGDNLDSCNNYYKGGSLHDYAANKVLEPDSDQVGKYNVRGIPCQEYYAYNKDFSIVNEIKVNFPLNRTYDYCSKCQNDTPYRIIASEVSYQEETVDTYKIFRPLNRTDLPGNTGPVQALKVFNDKLYAITEEGLYFIPAKPETLSASDSTVYLTKGERFSIPPKRILSNDFQYAGTTHDLSVISTEYGITYAHAESGKIFFFSDKLDELSGKGLRYFFHDNLRISLKDQLQSLGITYELDNTPTHAFGTGIISVYDPLKKRVIFSKKDYKYIAHKELTTDTTAIDKVIWDGEKFYINNSNNTELIINLDNKEYFENKSFTVSFSFIRSAWESFYSYLPDLFVNTHRTFFSIKDDGLYEHGQDNTPQTYYEKTYEAVIDFIEESAPDRQALKSIPTKFNSSIFYSLNLNTICIDDKEVVYPYRTFDRICLYNSYELSPIISILPKDPDNPFATVLNDNQIAAELTDREFELNNIRDYVVNLNNNPLFTSDWEHTQNIYPIDKVPNPQVYDINKNLYQMSRLRDRFLGIRLYFTPDGSERILMTLATARTKKTF